MTRKTLLATLLILAGCPGSIFAQNLRHSQNQISTPNISCLSEDQDGYIWIGTLRGVNRYNGSAFQIWLQGDNALQDDYITALCCDTGKRIWTGSSSGIDLIREGKIDPDVHVTAGRIGSIRPLDDGHLLYSNREGLFTLDKRTLEVRAVYLDPKLLYNSFDILSDGSIWIRNIASGDLTILDRNYRLVRELSFQGNSLGELCEMPDGSVYVCTETGLQHFSRDGQSLPTPEFLVRATDGLPVLFMVRKETDTFIGIRGKGIFYISNNALYRVWEDENLTDVRSCRALLTRENLWLSKNSEGLTNLYRNSLQRTVSLPDTWQPDGLNMFFPLGGGQVLIITNKGVFSQHLGTGAFTVLQGEGINGKDKLGIALLDKQNNLWLLHNYTSLRKYAIGEDRLALLKEWPVETTNCIWDDASGNVYLLQEGGILRFDRNGSKELLPAGRHPEFWFCGQFTTGEPYFLAEDSIWLLGQDQHFHPFEKANVPSPSCIWKNDQGIFWIGTKNKGVWKYNPQDGRLEEVDLGGYGIDRSIRSISGDRDGNIWIASRLDYIRIDPDGNTLVLNGMHAPNNTNSIAVTDNGSPVFGSTGRLTWVPSIQVSGERSIPLSLDDVIVNGETIMEDLGMPLDFRHDTRQLVFSFSGKNFDPNLQLIYQYRLDGYDRNWLYANQLLRAGYSGLRPGRYTFRVRVQQPDGTWSRSQLAIPVRIKPSPWLSWPIMLLYFAAVMGLIYFAIRLYIRFRLNREKIEISEQEKTLVEQISQERSTFFSNVSHEFRTPLSLIYGPIKELGKSPSLTENDKRLVSLVERNSERMLRLTDQFLHFNQSQANRDSLSIMRTDLVVLLRQMLQNFEYMFAQKNLHIFTTFPTELIAYCDREKVERIIFNLLSNAVKYTPEHGQIHVSARTEGASAFISVTDTGIGISPDKMERIFERYERLGEQVGETLPSGFGIGLNYARHLAEVHKGDLTVRPNQPLGSIFTFSFPWEKDSYAGEAIWEEEHQEQMEPDVPKDRDVTQEKINLLIVEDNADMRSYIRGFLQEIGNVTLAGDGEEAWKLIRLDAPDLIVSDVMMPYKDGYTLCKEIKNDPEYCHIPIILLTAKADMENQIHGLDLGADGYLSKPFDPVYLTALVRNLLANRMRLQGMLADITSQTEAKLEDGNLVPQDKAFLEKCYRIIDEHIAEEDFGVTVLSMEMGMSRTSIFSKLKALVGESPQTFLTNYRLNRGMELLKTHEYNISEVAYKVGFATLTGFSRSFKKKFGVPPSQI